MFPQVKARILNIVGIALIVTSFTSLVFANPFTIIIAIFFTGFFMFAFTAFPAWISQEEYIADVVKLSSLRCRIQYEQNKRKREAI